ncbi:MAG: thiolase family protein [Solirubrobacterales bacterium]
MSRAARIVGAAEATYVRHPGPEQSTESFIAAAVAAALADAGVGHGEVDGLAVSSFSLAPDHAVDLVWKLGMTTRWVMQDPHGGASGINMLLHAVRAIEAGDAETIVLCSADRMEMEDFLRLTDNYNSVARDYLAALPTNGPNALFAFLSQRFGAAHGLEREDFACLPIAQRAWAAKNPGAAYRSPMTLADYMEAPMVTPPLCRFDCVPVVSGGDAIVVTSEERAAVLGGPSVGVRAIESIFNHDHQDGDGIHSGFGLIREELWRAAGVRPEDVGAAYVYDDYPVMALVQLDELGLVPDRDVKRFLHQALLERAWPMNTSGGQLSAGQAGAAGGMHGLVESVQQLRGRGGERQVEGLELALVSGYGMILYTHGTSHNAAVLERHG